MEHFRAVRRVCAKQPKSFVFTGALQFFSSFPFRFFFGTTASHYFYLTIPRAEAFLALVLS